jgi:hypothetical protein
MDSQFIKLYKERPEQRPPTDTLIVLKAVKNVLARFDMVLDTAAQHGTVGNRTYKWH